MDANCSCTRGAPADERRLEIDHRLERLDVDDDVPQGVFRDVAALGDDHRDRLADEADLVLRERQLRADVKLESRNRRRRHQQRARDGIVAQVVDGVDRDDARALARFGGVDAFQPRVRVVAAQERHVQHPRQLHIVHEQGAAGEQPRVFVPEDALAKVACLRLARVTASTMCW